MANLEDLQQKEIELDLSNVPKDQQSSAKEAVANFVLDEILTRVASGRSPVTGGKFKKLNEMYADKMKGGDPNPNLYLEGDMLSSLGYKPTKAGIAVGIMDPTQRPKADGHNNFSGESKLPVRRFIAGSDQNFVGSIMNEIPKIISEFEVQDESSQGKGLKVTSFDVVSSTTEPISVTLSNILTNADNDIIATLLRRIIK